MKTTVATIAVVLGLVVSLRAEDAPTELNGQTQAAVSPSTNSGAVGKAWPHEASDLKPDSRIVWGKLANGLKYAILPTQSAPTRASLRLYMDVGSLMETDSQRGLAHFLEHMAFNGTKHFPAGEVDEHFQRVGMKSGADTNATTNFNKTVYQLELPRANEELMDDGLTLFRDFLDGMQLDQKQIDRERGVILSEIVYRDSAQTRAIKAGLQFMLPETLASRRWPVGDAASVRGLTRQQFVDFYETWYTPQRATVVAVGDFDVKMVERLIEKRFQDAKTRRGEQADPTFGKIAATSDELAQLRTDSELQSVSVELSTIQPITGKPDSMKRQRQEIIDGLAMVMLNQRFDRIAATEKGCIQSASMGNEFLFNLAEVTTISATCQPEKIKAAIEVMEQETRRALLYGFTDAEFTEGKTKIATMVEALAARAETQQPSDLANEMVDSLVKKEVNLHPSYLLAMAKSVFADLKKEDCQAALRTAWDAAKVKIWVQGDVKLAGDASRQLLDFYHASQQIKVDAPADATASKFAYTDFGAPGKIVARNDQPDLGVVEGVFANHVRVNIKQTAFEKNTVRVLVRFGGGVLELPADKAGLKFLASNTFIAAGLQAHSFSDLASLTADKKIGVRFSVGDDAFQLGGSCAPDSLDAQLQVCTAYLTAPGYRPEALKQFFDTLDAIYATVEHTAEGAVGIEGSQFLHGNDARFGLPPRAALQKLTLDDMKAWLARPLQTGYLEVSIVGDIDPDTALATVAKTLGALPARDAVKPDFKTERAVKFPETPKAKDVTFVSQATRAMSIVCWPTKGARDIPLSRRTDVLATILNDRLRLKVREELGATYTPVVVNADSQTFLDFGCLEADLVVEAEQLPKIGQLVSTIAAEMATGTISDDEFDRAMKPLLSSLDLRKLNNGYWLNTISDCQEHPEALDVARKSASDYRSITKSEIEQLAKRFLAAGQGTIINVKPTAAPSVEQPASFPTAVER